MKTNQNVVVKIFSFAVALFFMSLVLTINQSAAQTNTEYKVIEIKTVIGEGKDKEVKVLFEGERRKIAQLTLRNGKNLESHSVEEPIAIQCVAGNGEVIIMDGDKTESINLKPDTFITIESNVMHDVIANPSVSILLIRFLNKDEN